jgi:hypothetical protein
MFMKTVLRSIGVLAGTLTVGALVSGTVLAAEANQAVVKPLLQQDLSGIPGKEVVMSTVESRHARPGPDVPRKPAGRAPSVRERE